MEDLDANVVPPLGLSLSVKGLDLIRHGHGGPH
jgi:hypothetical protein